MKGILFTQPMIKAIVCETRRLQGLEEINYEPQAWTSRGYVVDWAGFHFTRDDMPTMSRICKPRYHAGETVYIKEKALYWVSPIFEGVEYDKPSDWWSDCVYQDDPEVPTLLTDNKLAGLPRKADGIGSWQWKSRVFMPAHYARYFIRITGVRPERLWSMTEQNALAEGIEVVEGQALLAYSILWDKLNPRYPFKNNYWVWRYQFEMVKNG